MLRGLGLAQEGAMNPINSTSGQLLYSVVNSTYISDRGADDMPRHSDQGKGEFPGQLSETLKGMASALFPLAASGD